MFPVFISPQLKQGRKYYALASSPLQLVITGTILGKILEVNKEV